MIRYVEIVKVPFLVGERAALQLDKTHAALTVFDYFRGQTIPEFNAVLQKHKIFQVPVPPNC